MDEIYVNVKCPDPAPSTNHTGQMSSKRSFYLGVILCLSLLSVFLLVTLITLGLFYHNCLYDSAKQLSEMNNQLSSMGEERDVLNANLSAVSNNLSSITEERDLLNANLSAVSSQLSFMTKERDLLTEKTKELKRLLCLSNQNKTCPAGWSKFSCSCYLLSERSASWDEARKDCRDRGADLVVIDSPEDQTALSNIATTEAWIGLNDKEQEGTWKWLDGTPLTLIPAGNWEEDQPDNGGGSSHWGEEDCVHVRTDMKKSWNDRSCSTSFKWICEKTP
ncbi:CD209 antigen-like protein C [Oreochromis aureus]|uniref:CD209 antigen-like protein C n=1 Tax=Oreochromis aureus TaxID=47969 RepID=UPI0019535F48|nr:CD209 antigen-like protein C [Oreochromis aureus]